MRVYLVFIVHVVEVSFLIDSVCQQSRRAGSYKWARVFLKGWFGIKGGTRDHGFFPLQIYKGSIYMNEIEYLVKTIHPPSPILNRYWIGVWLAELLEG